MRYVFHLSIPVDDLTAASQFYEQTLGATRGRTHADWLDILLWGHQLTLQLRPDEVLATDRQGKRHFGVVLPWDEWQALADALVQADTEFFEAPAVLHANTPNQQAKFYLRDPSNNIIEIKTYKDFARVLGTKDAEYDIEAYDGTCDARRTQMTSTIADAVDPEPEL